MNKPLKLAHRGLMRLNTENTIEAFQDSLDRGFDGIELDAQVIATGEIIVFHDSNLKRMAKDNRRVADLSKAELEFIKLKGGFKIPLLSDVLKELQSTTLFIEIKSLKTAKPLAQLLNKTKHKQHIVVASKQAGDIYRFKRADKKETETAFITSKRPILTAPFIKHHQINYVAFHHWLTNWIGISMAKKAGLKVLIYPIKNKMIDRVIRGHNVDGIMYDRDI